MNDPLVPLASLILMGVGAALMAVLLGWVAVRRPEKATRLAVAGVVAMFGCFWAACAVALPSFLSLWTMLWGSTSAAVLVMADCLLMLGALTLFYVVVTGTVSALREDSRSF